MGEFGAAISEQGIPVNTASDDQKVLDTRWKTLDIFAEYTYTNTLTINTTALGNGSNIGFSKNFITIFSHNLGYLPGIDYIVNSYSVSDPNPLIEGFFPYADANNVYLAPIIGSVLTSLSLTISITIRIYALDITTFYQAPTQQPESTVNPNTSEFGAEFINPKFASPDIQDASIEQYSFSTKLRPLNILQHGIASSTGNIAISYNYPKKPLYLLATYLPNGLPAGLATHISLPGPLVGDLGFQGGRGTITNDIINIRGVQASLSGNFVYILFKDPIDITQ